ncbi:MAG: carbohydrate kinase [Clostridia bacterium]
MNKLICIGECLIDFLPMNNDGVSYIAKAGGAPANVCASVAKLGGEAYYLGKLSTDSFGQFLLSAIKDCGVNTDFVQFCQNNTALAMVTLDKNGDRKFAFYRENTADLLLDKAEISEDMFECGDVLHFCSVGLVESPTKYAHERAIELARAKGAKVSFDVNVRLGLWQSEELCKSAIKQFLAYADIVKVTDEELQLITEEKEEILAVSELLKMSPNAQIIFVTKGKNGATVYDRTLDNFTRNAVDVKVVDTTGAGDCFSGGILFKLLQGTAKLNLSDMRDAVDFASYACGVVIGKKGAMQAMPTYQEVINLKKSMQ